MNWCGIQESAFAKRLRLVCISRESFQMLTEVHKKFKDYDLEGMTKPAKERRDEHGSKVVQELPLKSLENLVNMAGRSGLKTFLEGLLEKEYTLAQAKPFATKWARKVRK